MNLSVTHMAVLRAVRERLELITHDSYICFCIVDICGELCDQEAGLWYNRLLFWQRWRVQSKWADIQHDLCKAVNWGISHNSTFGSWLENQMRKSDVEVAYHLHHNELLYKWGRLAWLDRSLETGVLK